MKTGVLLLNLGTPQAPNPKEVGRYLREFLMDPLVVDIAYPLRWILVHALIVPRRSHVSASQYRKVWTEEGSPLLVHTLSLAQGVQKALGDRAIVEPAMRYGTPSIFSGVRALQEKGAQRIVAFPMYPQYSLAATESSVRAVKKALVKMKTPLEVSFLPAFYAAEPYLDAVAAVSSGPLSQQPFDLVLFSFHGLPERQVKRTDPSGTHCLKRADCCDQIGSVNRDCYRAQCYATARELARRLNIPAERYRVCFQSRLGRTPWIKPFSDEYYRELPKQGTKRVVVFCPSFVADCLETLEEVTIRGGEEFRRHGGETLTLIPSLNSSPQWVTAVAAMVSPHL